MKKLLQLAALSLALAAPAFATIAHDASSEGTGTTSLSWTHTPVGTPKGVLVFCLNNTNADVFSGATYGGVAMTQVNNATDGAGEPGFTEAYFLGASIPTGAQTAACTVSTGSTNKHGVAYTVTASRNTELAGIGSCKVEGDTANPSCSITGVLYASYAAAAMHSGQNSESCTAGTDFTIGPGNDYGTQTTCSERGTSQKSSGNWTVAFTVGSEDVAMVGVAIQEVQTPPTISPNTADANDFGADTTPTLEATATDGESDDVRYTFQIDSVNTFDSQGSAASVDSSYVEANASQDLNFVNGRSAVGQSFTSGGGTLDSAKFYLKKTGSPTGNAFAKVYAHSGTLGTSSVPTGSYLAVSAPLDVSTLTTSLQVITFTFSGPERISLTASTNYVLTIEYVTDNTSTNYLVADADSTSPAHGGNLGDYTGTWTANGALDLIFYIYIGGKTPRLSKVSGTDSGFANTVSGGDTDPFNSGEKVSFTVQGGDALAGGTWYWRARAKDPSGTNLYSSWTATRSFTIATGTDFPRSVSDAFFGPNELSARVYGAVRSPADAVNGGSKEISSRIYGAIRSTNESTSFVADISARIRGANISVFDAVNGGSKETVSRAGSNFGRSPSDAVVPAELIARMASFPRSVNEAFTPGEVSTRIAGFPRSFADGVGASEISSRLAGLSRTAADAHGAAEAVSKTADHPRAASEATRLQEYPARVYGAVRSTSEAFIAAEIGTRLAGYFRSTTDAFFIPGDSSVRGFQYTRTASEAFFVPAELGTRTYAALRSASEAIGAAENAARLLALTRAASDAGGAVEHAARLAGYSRAVPDASGAALAAPSESSARLAGLTRSLADAAGAADSPVRTFNAVRAGADGGGAGDLSTRLYAAFRNAAEAATLVEWGARLVSNTRLVADALIPSDISDRQVNNNRQEYDRVGSDAGLFGDAATRVQGSLRNASEAVGAAEGAARLAAFTRTASEAVFVADFGARVKGLVRSGVDAAGAAENATRLASNTRAVVDGLVPSELGARLVSNTRAASDAAFVADIAARSLGFTRVAFDSVSDAARAADASARTAALTRSVADQIFLPELGRPLNGRPVLRRSQVY